MSVAPHHREQKQDGRKSELRVGAQDRGRNHQRARIDHPAGNQQRMAAAVTIAASMPSAIIMTTTDSVPISNSKRLEREHRSAGRQHHIAAGRLHQADPFPPDRDRRQRSRTSVNGQSPR